MAIYRPPKPRWPLALAAAFGGAIVGLLIGLVTGSSEPDPVEAGRQIKTALVAAAGSLEVAAIEYEESVSDGEIVRETEYRGSLQALASSRARYNEVRPILLSLFPSQVEPIDAGYDEIEAMMSSRADPERVASHLQRLGFLLKGDR